MAEFINTADVIGDDEMCDRIIQKTVTEYKENRASKVGKYAFYKCKNLTVADTPNATDIGSHAFYGCGMLETAVMPKVTSIGDYGMDSTGVTEVVCPNVSRLYTGSFRGCVRLRKADFSKLTRIDYNSFIACSMLDALIIRNENSVCYLDSTHALVATPIANGTGYIYVPSALVDSYKAATNWSTYADQFRALEDYTVDGTVTGELLLEPITVDSPVMDGLVEWFEPGDSTQWQEDGTLISKINSGHVAYNVGYGNESQLKPTGSAPSKYVGNLCDTSSAFADNVAAYGIGASGFTLEFLWEANWNQYIHILARHPCNMSGGTNTCLLHFNNNFFAGYQLVPAHVIVTCGPDATTTYINGCKFSTSTALSETDLSTAHPICRSMAGGGVGSIRLYNRVLSEEEIRTNFLYAATLTNFIRDHI